MEHNPDERAAVEAAGGLSLLPPRLLPWSPVQGLVTTDCAPRFLFLCSPAKRSDRLPLTAWWRTPGLGAEITEGPQVPWPRDLP